MWYKRPLVLLVVAAIYCGLAPALARAELCAKCRSLMYLPPPGHCEACGAATESAALRLCDKCSAKRHQCEHCLSTLPAGGTPESKPVDVPAEKPAVKPAEKPPATLPDVPAAPLEKPSPSPPVVERIDASRPGVYNSGKWQYQLQFNDRGTPNEVRWGLLLYEGHKLPRGELNDYYLTPWGPVYWVGVPRVHSGLYGWMPSPLAGLKRQGRELKLPTPSSLPPPAAKPARQPPGAQTLNATKADNGKMARVRVGDLIVIRLMGNPTAGYQWQAVVTGVPYVRLVGQPQYVPDQYRQDVAGAGGTYVFTYQAVQPGTAKTAIRINYVRQWEQNTRPAESFSLSVQVLQPPVAAPPPASSRQ